MPNLLTDSNQLNKNAFCVLVMKKETKDKENTMASFSKQQILGGTKIVYVEITAVGITGLKLRVASYMIFAMSTKGIP